MNPTLAIFIFNPLELVILLVIAIPIAMGIAARRGHRMSVAVCLALIIIGAIMLLAPIGMSFILQMLGRTPRFSQDEQITCWVVGGIFCFLGVIGSFLAKRSTADDSK